VHQGDPFYIFEHFDLYYSIIEARGSDAASSQNLMRSFDLLYLTVDKLFQDLQPLLTATEPLSNQQRKSYLNLTKMTLFLQVSTVKKINNSVQQDLRDQQVNVQKKRAKQAEGLEQFPNWDAKRGKFLVQLFNVLQCPLEKLWSPPVAEEDFITYVLDLNRVIYISNALPSTVCSATSAIAHSRCYHSVRTTSMSSTQSSRFWAPRLNASTRP